MSELRQILDLWRTARARGEDVCLATVVRVEGSSYRKPGARMLMTSGGQRSGTISGGCLEAEVQKKAWWLTETGSTVQRYSSFFDEDSEMPYGLGCGGTVYLLLERGEAAERVLEAVAYGVEHRRGLVFVTTIDTNMGDSPGVRLICTEDGSALQDSSVESDLADAEKAIRSQKSFWEKCVFVEYLPPPQALFVYGAGDDAIPLVEFADRLGWATTVMDGRANLARAGRFPLASQVLTSRSFNEVAPEERDAAVILTHSYEQDRRALLMLLPRGLAYLGILGPGRRTARLLQDVAPETGLSVAECHHRLHSPVGLNIGAKDPVSIALSIVAEIHAVLERREAAVKCSAPTHA